EERLEDLFPELPGNDLTVAADRNAERVFRPRLKYPYHHLPGCIFYRIADQVAHDLVKCFHINERLKALFRQLDVKRQRLLFRGGRECQEVFFDELWDIGLHEAEGKS